jgi:hypothetical protein
MAANLVRGSSILVVLLLIFAGCDAGTKNKASVKGKVLADGQPVTGGSVTFMPVDSSMEATPASGEVKPDGTFVLTTDKAGDGAAVGKHNVSYSPPVVEQPEWDGYGTKPPQKAIPYEGYAVKETQVEVKSGSNDLTIELVKGGGS